MAKISKTNAARILDRMKIHYELIPYEVDEEHLDACHVADQIGEDIRQVFKTLVLRGDRNGIFICVIPGNREVNLKSAARISGNKSAEMIHVRELLATTGYIRGGCSPIGMKKAFPTYIHDSCMQYPFIYVSAGQRGLQIAEAEMPDFIITDVMMPVMDGLTMVHRIKQNKDICHIPIIVLSAKASLDDRLQGLREGIDDYITKPFSATYLKLRVENIIGQRRMIQQNNVTQLDSAAADTYRLESPQIVDADKEMMKRLMVYLEENIANPGLKIDDLAAAVNLGRSVFYGKMKSIVGMTPVDFVRHIRIQRAEELITKSDYSFSQIAYSIGFSDPKYFSKCFKKETGMTPSEYRDKADRGEAQGGGGTNSESAPVGD